MVWPFFTDSTTLFAPIVPPPHGRFTASTGVLSRLEISAPMARALMSAASPGASGTTMLIGPLGKAWACAYAVGQASARVTTSSRTTSFMASPSALVHQRDAVAHRQQRDVDALVS